MNRNIRLLIGILISSLFLFTACEEDERPYESFDPANTNLPSTFLLSRPNQTIVVNTEEEVTSFQIGVAVWGGLPESDITIPIVIKVETTLPSAGFTLTSANLTIQKGKNNGSLTVNLNRDEITPGVVFYIYYSLGTPSEGNINPLGKDGRITTFNPGPLAPWIGKYSVAAVSYGSPGDWDEAWTVTTELDPADPLNNILIKGIAGSPLGVIGKINIEAGTITVASNQSVGNVYGYGTTIVILGDEDFNVYPSAPLVGTVDEETGEIFIDLLALQFIDGPYPGYVWDVFECTFTKNAKNSVELYVPAGKKVKVN
jgi:hypothetical protein